jgi:hypothetical protein
VNPLTGDVVGMQPKKETVDTIQPTIPKVKSGNHQSQLQISFKLIHVQEGSLLVVIIVLSGNHYLKAFGQHGWKIYN